jgi:hypothetical protein
MSSTPYRELLSNLSLIIMKNSAKSGIQIVSVISLFALLTLSGCATVKFYSDPDLKKETGLRYYTLKPYLLVEYKAEKDNTVKTNVVYLPDLFDPQFMKARTGIGKNDIKMTFANSALVSYGAVSQSQIPELMEAFANMLSKSAYAAQAFTGPVLPSSDDSGTYFRLYEITPGTGGTALKEVVISNR